MSAKSREELLTAIRPEYLESGVVKKKEILDSFVAATGYHRKSAVRLLSKGAQRVQQRKERVRKYNQEVIDALTFLWDRANRICSKRLMPFLPSLITALERSDHLNLPEQVKNKLLIMSPATADRLLKQERRKIFKGKSTTKPGSLLKKHIPIQTFANWNDVRPGFFEADLVAHCGQSIRGQFLYTLTMTDIATGWMELAALRNKTSMEVLGFVIQIRKILPFRLLGFDSDNGSEFINENMVKWCAENAITFTRSREYRKNDQAHVEQKNGSIVRRMIGYERYEGECSWQILQALYKQLRLYINFFQPSMKLCFKERSGARVRKRYDQALTPYQRLLESNSISDHIKADLTKKYESLDPSFLLDSIHMIHGDLLATAVKSGLSELRTLAMTATELVIDQEKLSA